MEPPSAILRGDRLLACRMRLGFDRKEVAEAAGMSVTYLGLLERNIRRQVSAEKVALLALKLGVSVDYLLGLSDKETRDPDDVGTEKMRRWQLVFSVPKR